MPIRRLQAEDFEITGWFMNPNIQPLSEYLRRREAAAQCAEAMNISMIFEDGAWNIGSWLRQVHGRDEAPERCAFCCESRIAALCEAGVRLGYGYVSTSLLYSRYQPHELIARTGQNLARERALAFVYRDFREDWQAGIDLSKSLGLYRQPYCGCVYSEAERYRKKLQRLLPSS